MPIYQQETKTKRIILFKNYEKVQEWIRKPARRESKICG